MTTLRWTAPVLLAARDSDEDESKPRKWTSRAYNGGLMRPESPKLDAPLILNLAGATFAPSVVANLFHDNQRIVGHVTDKLVAVSTVDVGGVVSGGGEDAEHFVKAAGNGFPWQASLEANLSRVQKLAAGKSETINGQQFTGPLYVARASRIFGVGFLGRGADEGTSVTLAAGAADFFAKETDMEYQEWLAAMELKEEALTDAQKAKLRAKYDAECETLKAAKKKADNPDPKPDAPTFDIGRLEASYARHRAELGKVAFKFDGKVADQKLAEMKASALEAAVELKGRALDNEWAPEKFENEALTARHQLEIEFIKETMPKGPAVHAPRKELTQDVLMAAACQTIGLNTNKQFTDQVLEAAHEEFKGRISLGAWCLSLPSAMGTYLVDTPTGIPATRSMRWPTLSRPSSCGPPGRY